MHQACKYTRSAYATLASFRFTLLRPLKVQIQLWQLTQPQATNWCGAVGLPKVVTTDVIVSLPALT
jgi:hypothetical protein